LFLEKKRMIKPIRTDEETRGAILEQFWEELAGMDITDITLRSGAGVVGEHLHLPVIGEPVVINRRNKTIIKAVDNAPVAREIIFVTLKYLLGARDLPLADKWVNPVEFVGGELYFRSHSFKTGPLEEKFACDPEGFITAGRNWGGSPQKMGDAAFTLSALPRLPITFVLWCADDEFPASVKILFDASAEKHVPLGVLAGFVNLTVKRLL
jgi:hypothetical protein